MRIVQVMRKVIGIASAAATVDQCDVFHVTGLRKESWRKRRNCCLRIRKRTQIRQRYNGSSLGCTGRDRIAITRSTDELGVYAGYLVQEQLCAGESVWAAKLRLGAAQHHIWHIIITIIAWRQKIDSDRNATIPATPHHQALGCRMSAEAMVEVED